MIDTKLIFADARSHVAWQARAVPDKLLRQVYAVAKMGPTSANCCPMRIVFVTSEEAKARLKPCLFDGNVVKTMNAPVTAIIAYDTQFDDLLPQLYPARDMRTGFASNAQLAATTAFRNSSLQGSSLQGSSLQGGYLIIAARARARARARDCGPALITPKLMPSSFQKNAGSRTFCAISVMAKRPNSIRAIRGRSTTLCFRLSSVRCRTTRD